MCYVCSTRSRKNGKTTCCAGVNASTESFCRLVQSCSCVYILLCIYMYMHAGIVTVHMHVEIIACTVHIIIYVGLLLCICM